MLCPEICGRCHTCEVMKIPHKMRLIEIAGSVCEGAERRHPTRLGKTQRMLKPHNTRERLGAKTHRLQEYALQLPLAHACH